MSELPPTTVGCFPKQGQGNWYANVTDWLSAKRNANNRVSFNVGL